MASKLVNVRLDPERARKARRLRERGVLLSDVVREAIDERYAQLGVQTANDAAGVVARVFERFPDPPGLPPRPYDVHNRHAARRAILQNLRTHGPR
jgi:hypothetical protein